MDPRRRFGHAGSSPTATHRCKRPAQPNNRGPRSPTIIHGASYFFDDGRGGWHAEGGAQATLVNNPRLDETTIPTLTFRRTHALTSFEFDVSGVLLSESDRNGYTTTLSYDASGHLARVTDPAGRSLSFETNAQGMITRATDPAGRQVSFVYDATGYLVTRLTDAAGGVTTFSYAPEPDPARPKYHLVRIVRPNGYAQSNAYEGAALASETGGPQDRTMLYAYDTPAPETAGTPSTSTTTITDPKGNVVVARHTNYLLTSLTRGSGSAQAATSSFTHDPVAMRPTSTTDPRGSVWRSTYDAGANLLTGTDPLGHTTTYTYDAQNQPRTETDPLGVTTTHSYDANSNLTSTSRPLTGTPDTQRTTYAYGNYLGRGGRLGGVSRGRVLASMPDRRRAGRARRAGGGPVCGRWRCRSARGGSAGRLDRCASSRRSSAGA